MGADAIGSTQLNKYQYLWAQQGQQNAVNGNVPQTPKIVETPSVEQIGSVNKKHEGNFFITGVPEYNPPSIAGGTTSIAGPEARDKNGNPIKFHELALA